MFAREAVGRAQFEGANHAGAQLLLHVQRDRCVLHLQRVVHLRHALARELDVDDGADDLDDLALVAHSVSLRLLYSLPIRTGVLFVPGLGMRDSGFVRARFARSEEHTSELQSLMRISYAVFCLNKKMTSTDKVTTATHLL